MGEYVVLFVEQASKSETPPSHLLLSFVRGAERRSSAVKKEIDMNIDVAVVDDRLD